MKLISGIAILIFIENIWKFLFIFLVTFSTEDDVEAWKGQKRPTEGAASVVLLLFVPGRGRTAALKILALFNQ